MTATPKTPREVALVSVPAEWREALLQRAADAGITGSDDAAWILVGAVVDAIAAASAAGDAAAATAQAVKDIPDAMKEGVTQAGAELRQTVMTAGDGIERRLSAVAAHAGDTIIRAQETLVARTAQSVQANLENEVRALAQTVYASRTAGAELLQFAGILSVAAAATLVGLMIGSQTPPGTPGFIGLLHAILGMPVGYLISPVAGWGTWRMLADLHPAFRIGMTALLLAFTLFITLEVF